MQRKAWVCIVGLAPEDSLAPGADLPMRDAVREAFALETGKSLDSMSSGWVSEAHAEHLTNELAKGE